MSYLQLAGLELLLLALTSGVVGTVIVLRRQAFFAVALSHATFPGGVIAALLGFNVLLGQAAAALILALILALLNRAGGQGEGAATGIVLVFGFALGSVLTALQSAYTVPVEQLLIGSIFGVREGDIATAAGVLVFALVTVLLCARNLLFDTFDSRGFLAAGGKALVPEVATALLTAAAITAAMPAVGAILAVALVVGPAATAQLVARNIWQIAPLALVFGALAAALGLWISLQFSVAAGGAIGLAVAALFLVVLAGRKIARSCRLTRSKAA